MLRSLDASPPYNCLRRAKEADDHHALATLAHDAEIVARAEGPKAVQMLWDVCQVPDFRKVMSDQHTRLLSQIFLYLAKDGRVPDDWVDGQVKRLESTEGDIDTLVTRIATYPHLDLYRQPPELDRQAAGWQERTRAIEDRLSDALHERLTQRFVDRRAAGGLGAQPGQGRRPVGRGAEPAARSWSRRHTGRPAGWLSASSPTRQRWAATPSPVLTAARRALRSEIARQVTLLELAPDSELTPDRVSTRSPGAAPRWRGWPRAARCSSRASRRWKATS